MQLSGSAIAVGAMTGARVKHAMALTGMGVILICGGKDASGTVLATAELYVVGTGQCIATGNMNVARYGHTATLLTDGRILIVGGQGVGDGYLASAEYFYARPAYRFRRRRPADSFRHLPASRRRARAIAQC
jgi:hypothetical protein